MTAKQLRLGARLRAAASAMLASGWLLLAGAPTHAKPIPLHFEATTVDAVNNKTTDHPTEAGAHPDLELSLDFGGQINTVPFVWGNEDWDNYVATVWKPASARKIRVDFPPGMVGNPNATPRCTWQQFTNASCPESTVIGSVDALTMADLLFVNPDLFQTTALATPGQKVFNLDPAGTEFADAPGLIGIQAHWDLGGVAWGRVDIPMAVRLSPGLNPHLVAEAEIPATTYANGMDPKIANREIRLQSMKMQLFGAPDGVTPFLTNPTSCGPATFGVTATSPAGKIVKSHAGFNVTGCDQVPFSPEASVTPAESAPGSAGAVSTKISVPTDAFPRSQAHVRELSVRLPDGVALSPGVAADLKLCSSDQFDLDSAEEAACPAGSRIGQSTMKSPLLANSLVGGAFLGERSPGPLLGFPLFVEVASATPNVRIKLQGTVTVSNEGDVVAVFKDLPQLPFSLFELEFKGKPGAVMVAPGRCGTVHGQAMFASWAANAPIASDVPLTIAGDDAICGPRFSPTLAVSGSLVAGAPGDLRLRVARRDGDGPLTRINVSMPGGYMGDLTAAEMCADQAAGGGTCPESTRVGDVAVSAGPADDAVTLPGAMYLTGPYETGDVAGLSIVVPAKVGPLDLGTVVLRAGIGVRRDDAGLEIHSSQLPTMLAGVPLQISAVDMHLTKPGFMRNPTGCDPRTFRGTFDQLDGASASADATVTAQGCDQLAAAVEVSAAVSAERAPSFSAEIKPRPGAAMSQMDVSLPDGLSISLPRVGAACAIERAHAGTCAPEAIVGEARAVTPVIGEPLSGPVVLVASQSGGLPGMLVLLRNSAGTIKLALLGEVSFVGGSRIKTTFRTPDVPLDSFRLSLKQDGVLTRLPSLCNGAAKIDVHARFHNGKQQSLSQPLAVAGCGTSGASKPKLIARLTKAASRQPRLELDLNTTTKARKLRVVLPKGVAVRRIGGIVVAPRSAKVALKNRTVTITTRRPASRIRLRLQRGLRVSNGLRATLTRSRKLPIAVVVDAKRHRGLGLTVSR